MHLIAIRRELYERQPWIGQSLYDAFVESKRRARNRMRYAGSLSVMLPWLIDDVEEIDEVFAGDAFPYGVEANRATLRALIAYMVEQHFIARAMPIEDLFVPARWHSGNVMLMGTENLTAPRRTPESPEIK